MKTILALSDPRLNNGKLPSKVVELAQAADLVLCAEITSKPAYEALKTMCGGKMWPLPGEKPIIQDWGKIKICLANKISDDQFADNPLMLAAEDCNADLLVFGHINQPIIVWGKGKMEEGSYTNSHMLICPGSSSITSIYKSSFPSVALLHVNDNKISSVELVRIASLQIQNKWRRCRKCQGLFFAPNEEIGKCPAGGKHDGRISEHYFLAYDDPNAAGQSDWRLCKKCQVLFFAPNLKKSICPADGRNHDKSGSGNYTVICNDPAAPGQAHWRWCKECQGLFFAEGNTGGIDGVCPKDMIKKVQHSKLDSGHYQVETESS
jgi:hypothetical protein